MQSAYLLFSELFLTRLNIGTVNLFDYSFLKLKLQASG